MTQIFVCTHVFLSTYVHTYSTDIYKGFFLQCDCILLLEKVHSCNSMDRKKQYQYQVLHHFRFNFQLSFFFLGFLPQYWDTYSLIRKYIGRYTYLESNHNNLAENQEENNRKLKLKYSVVVVHNIYTSYCLLQHIELQQQCTITRSYSTMLM